METVQLQPSQPEATLHSTGDLRFAARAVRSPGTSGQLAWPRRRKCKERRSCGHRQTRLGAEMQGGSGRGVITDFMHKVSLQRMHKKLVTSPASGEGAWVAETEQGRRIFTIYPFVLTARYHVSYSKINKPSFY